MEPEASKYLFDMREACDLIAQFTLGKDLRAYQEDPQLRSAIERQFQVVGEALHQLSKAHPETALQIPSHRDIINFRHVLVHGYDKIENDVVWGVVAENLPALRDALSRLLSTDD